MGPNNVNQNRDLELNKDDRLNQIKEGSNKEVITNEKYDSQLEE